MLPLDQVLLPIKEKAILIYDGDNDDVIDVKQSIIAYNKLKSIGAETSSTLISGIIRLSLGDYLAS